jgi:uncharacterized membrane protein YadS
MTIPATPVEALPLLCGVGLTLALVALAVVVQIRRPPADGTSWFVVGVGFVVFLTILGLITRGGG